MRAGFAETARNERFLWQGCTASLNCPSLLCMLACFSQEWQCFFIGHKVCYHFCFWSELFDFCDYPEYDWAICRQKTFTLHRNAPTLKSFPICWNDPLRFCEYRAIWGHKMWCSGVKSLSHPSSFAAGAIKSKSDISTVFGCRMMCINTLSGVFGDKEKPSGDEALETCISPILPCSCCGSAAAGSGSKSWGSTKPSMCTDNAEPFRSLPPACIYLKLLRVFFLFFNLVHWCTGSNWDGVNNLCRCRAAGWICDSNSADNALLFWLLLRSACTAPRLGLFISLSAHTFPSVNRLLLSRKLGENTAGRGGFSWP